MYSVIISKIRHFTNLNSQILIYYALVYPYLTYGNLIWGNTYPTRIQKFMNIQKKITRLMTFKSYLDHTDPLFITLKLLNIFQINNYLTSLFMYRYNCLKDLPGIFSNYFVTNDKIHHHNTRNSKKIHKIYLRTNYIKHMLCSKGIDME